MRSGALPQGLSGGSSATSPIPIPHNGDLREEWEGVCPSSTVTLGMGRWKHSVLPMGSPDQDHPALRKVQGAGEKRQLQTEHLYLIPFLE